MNIKDFKPGRHITQDGYSSYLPETINNEWEVSDSKVIKLLNDATRKLGELHAFSTLIPDVDFFIRMHVFKEATKSSKIEGTQTSLEEAIQDAKYISPEKQDDWHEVHNYINAMNYAISQLNRLPLCNRLLKQTHKKLIHGVRGKHKLPGEFRTSQNWIGGASLKDAIYIPPHYSDVPYLMSDLEKFLNNNNLHVPPLIKIGIAHYQFESIHPFLDGNGRLGRLMITLYLVNDDILGNPVLYLSDFFERNRRLYYDNLSSVRIQHSFVQWLTFFLAGVLETAENSIQTFHHVINLRKEVEEKKIINLGKRIPLAMKLIQYLYSKPIVDASEVANVLGIDRSTAYRLIHELEGLNILKEKTGFKRNRVFVFELYLNIFER